MPITTLGFKFSAGDLDIFNNDKHFHVADTNLSKARIRFPCVRDFPQN